MVCLIPVQGVCQRCDGIKCVREFCSTDLSSCLQRYAQNVENPHYKDMVEATFECFEALLNYSGKFSSLTNSFLYIPAYNSSLCHIHTCTCSSGQGSTGRKHRVIDKDCHT